MRFYGRDFIIKLGMILKKIDNSYSGAISIEKFVTISDIVIVLRSDYI